jgi:outer membrane protein
MFRFCITLSLCCAVWMAGAACSAAQIGDDEGSRAVSRAADQDDGSSRTVLLRARSAQIDADHRLDVDEAVYYALVLSPTARQQAWQVELSRGAVRAASGQFDSRLIGSVNNARASSFSRLDVGLGKSTANVTSYRLGLTRQFASGLQVEPYLEMERTEILASSVAPIHQTFLGAELAYPLLRGRGADAVAAERQASVTELRAATARQRFVASQVVYETLRAYWQLLAARDGLAIAREAEQRGRRTLEETHLLVKSDEKPASDLQQPRASLASLEAQRITAERTLATARQQLGVVLGVSPEIARRLEVVTDSFPSVPDDLANRLSDPSPFVAAALARRTDLVAARRQLAASTVRRDAADDALQPRLDLALNVNYAGSAQWGTVQQYVSPFAQDVNGVNATVSLSTDLSFRNRSAEGRVQQQIALVERQSINADNLEREIRIGVATTVELLRGSVLQLERARSAVALSREVLQNEQRKYRLGMSTLFDVIVAEDRLTREQTRLLQAQRRYAELVAQLRFETQTLITVDGGRALVSPRRLITVPTLTELDSAASPSLP